MSAAIPALAAGQSAAKCTGIAVSAGGNDSGSLRSQPSEWVCCSALHHGQDIPSKPSSVKATRKVLYEKASDQTAG